MRRQPEADLQAKVLHLAALYGWRRAHFRTAYQPGAGKWVTPMSGETGFPDLVLLRPPRLIFAELKSDTGTMSPGQKEWKADLTQTPQVEYYLWRPRDLEDIVDILKR